MIAAVGQIIASVAAGTIISAGTVIVGMQIQAGVVRQRVEDAEKFAKQVSESHERLDSQRHEENRERLERIEAKVTQINGAVARHEVQIALLERKPDP